VTAHARRLRALADVCGDGRIDVARHINAGDGPPDPSLNDLSKLHAPKLWPMWREPNAWVTQVALRVPEACIRAATVSRSEGVAGEPRFPRAASSGG